MPHVPPFGIRADHLLAVIDGCQVDLEQSRFLDFPAWRATATWWPAWWARWRRASSATAPRPSLKYAHRLGLAMQLTNIIRDVGDDARRGRIYLPVSELQAVRREGPRDARRDAPWGYSERFTALMRFQARRAHATYDEALALLPERTATTRSRG
jgi:phytoene synthase